MDICKVVNNLPPEMSIEIYKRVFVDSLNKFDEHYATEKILEDKVEYRDKTLKFIEQSKFMGPEIYKLIMNILGNERRHRDNDFVTQYLISLPQPEFNDEEEKSKETQSIIGTFLLLIELTVEIEKLEYEKGDLDLRCMICKHKIVSMKVINCKICGKFCDNLDCCIPCIPKMYRENHDPYLCSTWVH